MNISLAPVSFDEKPILRQLMELYLYDFSEYEKNDVSEQGYYGYNYLDSYWYEEGRHPFFVRVDGKLAGFALVSKYCFLVKEENRRSMSEFFILRKYRGKGIGKSVAHRIFDKFPGTWEVVQYVSNIPSLIFWQKCIEAYVGDKTDIKVHVFEQGKKQAMIFENK